MVDGKVAATDEAIAALERRARSLVMAVCLATAASIKTGWNWTGALESKIFVRWAEHEAGSALNAPVVAAASVTKTTAQSSELRDALSAALGIDGIAISLLRVTRWHPTTVAVQPYILPASNASNVLGTVAATLALFVERARAAVATANAGVVGAPFGRPSEGVLLENNRTNRTNVYDKANYTAAWQTEMWAAGYDACQVARYVPALHSVEWGIRELVELERLIDGVLVVLYASFPDQASTLPF
jgi:hypothetical protein